MLPINEVQLVVSAFQTGELACNFLMYAKTLYPLLSWTVCNKSSTRLTITAHAFIFPWQRMKHYSRLIPFVR